MPILNRFAELHDEIAGWRRDFHENPELLYETHRTSARVAELLTAFGVDEVATGIGRTGVVGVIRGRNGGAGKTVGLRADMDALPIHEATGRPWASKTDGVMHACGHDGHTAMLLGAARYLAETRNFDGTVVVIFQPAEEGGAGAKAMVEDGLMTRFGIDEVYGMHNYPGLPVGKFAIRPGPLMAAADRIRIRIDGIGGHAARPHVAADPILAGAAIVQAAQQVVARNIDPLKSGVVSITLFQGGTTDNVIPESVELRGTARSLDPEVRDLIEKRLGEIVPAIASAYGTTARLTYLRDYPVTANDPEKAAFAGDIAAAIAGEGMVDRETVPVMGGEDFSFMLLERPGAFIFAGVGEDVANLHNPAYDFNDELIPVGCSYWVRLVETALPAGARAAA